MLPTPSNPWGDGSPVPISMPTNNPAPISTRTNNPYNRSIRASDNKKTNSIGNSTARSTLVHNSQLSASSGPPNKRRKFETTRNRTSFEENELNFIGTRSKYPFTSDSGSKSSFTIHVDGNGYKDLSSRFSSDEIDQFSSEEIDKGTGVVSQIVRQIEAKDVPQKIDFRKLKRKANNGKPLLVPRALSPDVKIPVQSFYSGRYLYESSPDRQLWMFTRIRELCFGGDSGECVTKLFDDISTMSLAKSFEVEKTLPVIQFKDRCKEEVTVLLDVKNPHWNRKAYIEFVGNLEKSGLKSEDVRAHTRSLWEMAVQNANAQSDKTTHWQEIDVDLSTTLESLKRRRSLDTEATRLQEHLGSSTLRLSSSSTRTLRSGKKSVPAAPAPANPDEVILSYPHGLGGAVKITNADMERLDPGAFLNDSLIEFGLKVWLKDLEDSNPELVDQIHVFSSFFYKKFNSNKNLQIGYDSVRKWTNKLDIFQKKYLIVPINENLHWYLAIIYEPEHILRDPPVDSSKPHQSPHTRLSTAKAVLEIESKSSQIVSDDLDPRSEMEVEHDLVDFQRSCTIEDDVESTLSTSPGVVIVPSGHQTPSKGSEDDKGTSCVPAVVPSTSANKEAMALGPVDAESFYRPAGIQRRYGKKKGPKASTVIEPHERDEVEIVEHVPKTYIFTFDSLGSRHVGVVKKLSQYLKMEAKDKKNLDAGGTVQGKTAPVPLQTNFCDCGVYLLHYARTFLADPRKYTNIILAPRPASIGDAERKNIWHVDKSFGSEGREQLRQRIESLSKDWKKHRDNTQKLPEEAMIKVDESDDEVELVQSDAGKTAKSSPKSIRKSQQHGRRTGPASRVRG